MSTCRFCDGDDLRLLASYPDYPIYIGCSDRPRAMDEVYDFKLYLCRSCGAIQQLTLPPLEILYRERAFFGRGRTWQEHYDEFCRFIAGGMPQGGALLEVGGGMGGLLKRMAAQGKDLHLFDVEPHPEYDMPEVTTYRQYFDLEFETDDRFDGIYSSHLVEHLTDVHTYFAKVRTLVKPGGGVFTACPNIAESFARLHLNAFTTDHFNYLSPPVLAGIAARQGFAVKRYEMFRDHSMYFHFEPGGDGAAPTDGRETAAELGQAFDRYEGIIRDYAAWAGAEADKPVYLFGAHAFTITMLRYLPSSLSFRAVLDNEQTKQNRRLSGTDLRCLPPEVLRDESEPVILIYMGAYTGEIVAQLKEINPSARLLRLDEFAAGREA